VLARLELLERRPAWGGGKLNAATVALAPLSDDETAALISNLSERPLLAAETQQGIIAARLDALPLAPAGRGRDREGVLARRSRGGPRCERSRPATARARAEGVRAARAARLGRRRDGVAFKHLLVRDVAYGQIPRAERAEKHRRAAEWIESLARPEDHAEMVADHYLNALELARTAGREVGTIAAPAPVALREAGDRAAALNALVQAERYYTEALALAREGDHERFELLFRLGRVRYIRGYGGADDLAQAREGLLAAGDHEAAAEAALMLADISWNAGSRDRMLEHLEDARALVADASPSRVQAFVLSTIARYEMLGDRNESAIEVGREALRMAQQLRLDDIRAHALNNIGSARVAAGDPGGLVDLEASIEFAAQLNSIPDLVRGYNNLGTMNLLLGRLDRARAEILESRRIAEHFGHSGFTRWAAGGPTLGLSFQAGSWDEVIQGPMRSWPISVARLITRPRVRTVSAASSGLAVAILPARSAMPSAQLSRRALPWIRSSC
jgi:tetratricopeptide (TPR) repeat protein